MEFSRFWCKPNVLLIFVWLVTQWGEDLLSAPAETQASSGITALISLKWKTCSANHICSVYNYVTGFPCSWTALSWDWFKYVWLQKDGAMADAATTSTEGTFSWPVTMRLFSLRVISSLECTLIILWILMNSRPPYKKNLKPYQTTWWSQWCKILCVGVHEKWRRPFGRCDI